MNKKIYFLLFSISILYSSCQDFFNGTVVEIDIPPHTSQLAPYAFFSDKDSLLSVMVGTSVGILDNSNPLRIENANVQLFKNDALLYTFAYNDRDSGYIVPLNVPFKTQGYGDTYRLEVSADNYDPVSATQVMPSPVTIDTVVYSPNTAINEFGEPADEYKITFTDPGGQANYYEISMRVSGKFTFPWDPNEIYEQEYRLYTSSLDPIFEAYSVLKDENIDGRTYTLTLQTDLLNYDGITVVEGGVYVELRSVSKEYYNYKKSLDTYWDSEDDPFAEPVLLYSNMSASLGMFGLFSTNEFLVEL